MFQDFHLYTEWNVDNVSGVHVVDTDSGREVNSNLLHASHSTAYDVIVFSKQYQAEYYPGKHIHEMTCNLFVCDISVTF